MGGVSNRVSNGRVSKGIKRPSPNSVMVLWKVERLFLFVLGGFLLGFFQDGDVALPVRVVELLQFFDALLHCLDTGGSVGLVGAEEIFADGGYAVVTLLFGFALCFQGRVFGVDFVDDFLLEGWGRFEDYIEILLEVETEFINLARGVCLAVARFEEGGYLGDVTRVVFQADTAFCHFAVNGDIDVFDDGVETDSLLSVLCDFLFGGVVFGKEFGGVLCILKLTAGVTEVFYGQTEGVGHQP